MRSLPRPTLNALDVFDAIAAAKMPPRQQRLIGARTLIARAYNDYAVAAPALVGLPAVNLTGAQKEALHHAFTGETSPLRNLRASLMAQIASVICPFCSISETSALDHYLPKELFAQFAVYPQNLIPSCSKCNTSKSTLVVVHGTNVRRFLHPYFDVVPAVPFLTVTVDVRQDMIGLTYKVVQAAGISAPEFGQLRAHFETLKLGCQRRRQIVPDGGVKVYQSG